MAFNTGNALGSTDPRDLSDNAENLDRFANGTDPAYNDRLSKSRKSLSGMESDFANDQSERATTFANFLSSSGYEFLGEYAGGIEVTEYNQIIRESGEFWRPTASTSLPYTTTGAGMPESGAFVAVGDAALRQEIGSGIFRADSLANLESTNGRFDGDAARLVSGTGRDGDFRWDASDLSSTLVVASATSDSVDDTTDTINDADHPFSDGDGVITQTTVNGLTAHTVYWVVNSTSGTYQLSATFGGGAIDLTGTTNVTIDHLLDPLQGVYVTPSSDRTGGSGAWIRQYSGPLNVLWFGAQAGVNSTAEGKAALDFGGGNGVFWPKIAGEYIAGPLIPKSNTVVSLEAGVVINAPASGSRVFQLQNENVHVWAYGAKTVMDGTQTSHNVLINYPAKNVSVHGLYAVGSGNTGDDCFYLGGNPSLNQLSENVRLIDCKGEGLGAGTRNGLSVVACDGYLIEGCEFWNSTGSPGAGIDLEANLYMADGSSALKRGTIKRCKVHSNDTGIACVFYDDCSIENCEIFNNNTDGIGAAASGTQFDDAVYRTGDRLGVISFDSTDGWIVVEDTNLITDDLGIGVGTILKKRTESGASWPTELSAANYVVNEISADQFSFRVGPYFDYGTITSLSGSTGTIDKDPAVSDLHWYVFREGNNSNLSIIRNKLYGNGTNGQIRLAEGANYHVEENDVFASGQGVTISFSRNVRVIENDVEAADDAVAYRGINVGASSEIHTENNKSIGFGGEGLSSDSVSRSTFLNDRCINCGVVGGRSARFQNGSGAKISSIIYNDKNHQSNNGLVAELTVTNSLIDGARCKDAGLDNASSIFAPGSGMVVSNSIQNDGTFRP